MERSLRFLGYALTLGILSLVFLFQFPSASVLSASLISAAFFLAAVVFGTSSLYLLGAALILLPLLGPGVLNAALALWLIGLHLGALFDTRSARGENRTGRELALFGAVLVLLPLLCGTVLTFALDFDPLLLGGILRFGGFWGLRALLSTAPPSWFRALDDVSGFIVAVLFFLTLVAVQNPRKESLRIALGAAVATFVSVLILIFQLTAKVPLFDRNITPFWRMVARYPASFADPNAFGVMAALLVPLFWGLAAERGKILFRSAAALLFIAAFWSGSRTFFLGVVLWIILRTLLAVRRAGRREYTLLFWFALLWFGIFLGLLGYPGVNNVLQQSAPHASIVRVLKTLNWDEASNMLSSRSIYGKVALQAWTKSPISGLGVERFYDRQTEFMNELGIDLGGWMDNANNYYLEVLAEQGLLGLALTLFACSIFLTMFLSPSAYAEEGEAERTSLERMSQLAKSLLGVFAVLLLTGPHLAFEEVRILIFVLVALAAQRPIEMKPNFLRVLRATVWIIICLFPAAFSFSASVGFVPKESAGFYTAEPSDRGVVRWTATPARLVLCGEVQRSVTLDFRTLEPGITKRPLKVLIYEGDEPKRDSAVGVELSDNNWTSITLPISQERSPVTVGIRVERLWSPAARIPGGDPRQLGVMVRWPKEAC